MAEGGTSRHWEAKRRDVKRAEARLTLGLRSLEEARLYYLNTMTKEQQRLQQELLRLQKSCSKQKFSLGPGHIRFKATLPLPSSLVVQNSAGFHYTGLRSRRKTLPKTGEVAWTKQSFSHPWKLSGDVSGYEGKRKKHLPPLEAKDPNIVDDRDMSSLKDSMAKQLNISAESVGREDTDIIEEQGKDSVKEEPRDPRAKDTIIVTKPMNLPDNRRPSLDRERLVMDPEAYAADGRLRTMYNRPDFLKSYGEVRKARYIRHKGIPAWEKELSLQDIFGPKKTMGHSS
ncbi:coiled-coil domain-containing protein 190-like [Crotalus tigris]|uniref:coiled-coil domain-containing protein 190-like n=1 Tax=Crotalus tigris TaxID=88082 RepID=UPI00192F8433|nr:coiled-coil domain-containing protein 190-like [Crotalus tigris]XP_039204931.1 coiled-coil domain-containing protein 190-like [Crotalus tigris]XP_039204932.1 coiled-coil domain-containing protein 190-like [Crotalus tigris]XP_039204933.1 coiled-coil domain-containing protein 190-like [Crotalus tigris]XP_039204934.1 coiled-coil domain-containing protein 190-like [Crotalus tigris]